MKAIMVEVWTCGNKIEVHFFRDNEVNDYVFGYNPKILSEEKVKSLLHMMGMKLPDE